MHTPHTLHTLHKLARAVSRRVGQLALLGAAGALSAACTDMTGSQPLPAGTSDPATIRTMAGARAMANTARAQFQYALSTYLVESGLLTDELQATARGVATVGGALDKNVAVDARILPAQSDAVYGTDLTYGTLQQMRAAAMQAIHALNKYDPDSSALNRGELYAQEGYTEIMLADLFCSGVPLSTMDFEADFTYQPSSTTDQVYTHAIALFDTASALAGGDTLVGPFAKIGKARALLALGRYDDAAAQVSGIPATYKYAQSIWTCSSVAVSGCATQTGRASLSIPPTASVADSEGTVGLPYRSSNDPRTQALSIGTLNGNAVWFPKKYKQNAASTVVVASGIEAQLIAAEAALADGSNTWLSIVNAVRTDGTVTGTTYNAGAGGVAGLAPLTDPGSDSARVSMLFRERAFWLFLTGERQGDLRRLARNYQRPAGTVFPNGQYAAGSAYGTYADAPIPISGGYSEAPNPLFHGCVSRD